MQRVGLIPVVFFGLIVCVSGVSRGQSFELPISAPKALNTNAENDGAFLEFSPHLGTDGEGTWVAVWASDNNLFGTIGNDNDIFFGVSTDDGVTWSAPALLNSNAFTDDDWESLAHVATDGDGTWVVSWNSPDDLGGTIGSDGDILFAVSTDTGATWSDPSPLNTNAGVDSGWDSGARIVVDDDSTWIAVWDSDETGGDTIGDDYDILYSVSSDGVGWSLPAPLNTNASVDEMHDTTVRLATDNLGTWVAVWHSDESPFAPASVGDRNDVFCAVSTNAGTSWSSPTLLNTFSTVIPDEFDSSPDIAADGSGNWIVVWGSEDDLEGSVGSDWDILYAVSTDDAKTWTGPQALNDNAGNDSGNDYWGRVTTDKHGTWVVVWESEDSLDGTIGTDSDLLYAVSTDTGTTWSSPVPFNTNASTDDGFDGWHQLVTDKRGTWVSVWHSNNSLGGTIGTDNDILTARFVEPEIWVFFDYAGPENGTFFEPFSTLAGANAAVSDGGSVRVIAGSTTETPNLDNPAVYRAAGGVVRVGAP